jgi:hypothetical protein
MAVPADRAGVANSFFQRWRHAARGWIVLGV